MIVYYIIRQDYWLNEFIIEGEEELDVAKSKLWDYIFGIEFTTEKEDMSTYYIKVCVVDHERTKRV